VTFVGYIGDNGQAHYEASRAMLDASCATGWVSKAEKAQLFADTAARFYRLGSIG
jgi:predicted TIM-barrel fold metal-dependent hydrolase